MQNVDYSKIKLIPATLEDYPVIQNMGRFYVYDMSEYMGKEEGWGMPENGLYECIDFKKYWEDKNSFPFLIRYQNEIAGFIVVDKKGSSVEIDFNMAQFFVLRKFKYKGIGRYVAQECFRNFSGIWEVMVMPGNEGAYRFWRATIINYTNNNFTEYTRDIAHFNNSRKNIFKFNSRIVNKVMIRESDNDPDVLKKDYIDIVPYNAEWPDMASMEISKLRLVLPPKKIIDIQHVGSTAILGMSAKPIIDIQIAANSLEEMKIIAIPALQKLGYEYWYENPDPERMFFVKGMPPFGENRTHHVHIVEPTSKHWQGKIIFRDYLIAHPEIAQEYQQLKIKLAQQYTYDREQYTDAKTKFINDILQKASVWKITLNKVETAHLQLQRPSAADMLILRELWKNEKVRKFLGGTISNEAINEKITLLQDHWDKYGFGQWSVVDKKHNQVIGICGLHYSEDGIELSYMFFPASWGKGLAKEAALASLDYGFNSLKFDNIIAITQEANHHSCRLLEKIGMHRINHFRRFDATQCLYKLTQSEWYLRSE